MLRLPLTMSLLFCVLAVAAAERVVTTKLGDEIPITVYPAQTGPMLLWIPSEFGTSPRQEALSQALAALGTAVWMPDLHAAWFLPTGRYSLNDVDPRTIRDLIVDALAANPGRELYLVAAGRSVALALAGVRDWQLLTDDTARLRGLLAFSPQLYVRTPQGGEKAEFLPIAKASNLPVYVLQPENASGFWHVAEDIRALEQGGSPVFLHRLPDVADGFFARPDFTPAEAAMTRKLPTVMRAAMGQLEDYGGTPAIPAAMDTKPVAPERPNAVELLRPFNGKRNAPALRLATRYGEEIDLSKLAGQVVLVNFWATWCPPCVEEIPSLQRLFTALAPEGLQILAIDVGETPAKLEAFLADKPVDFPVLLDPEAETVKEWGVYAFPTTMVLDHTHRIRYAVFGAFDWSSTEVIDTLRPLLEAANDAAAPPRVE